MSNYKINYSKDHLEHYGVLGMKWGVRRYQNEDGTRTALGKKRYKFGSDHSLNPNFGNKIPKESKAETPFKSAQPKYEIKLDKKTSKNVKNEIEKVKMLKNNLTDDQKKKIKTAAKKTATIGAAIVATGLAAYGAKKYMDYVQDKAFRQSWNEGQNAITKIMDATLKDSLDKGGRFVDYNKRVDAQFALRDDVWKTARNNSKNYRSARNYLKGNSASYSAAQLANLGINTFTTSEAANDILKKYLSIKEGLNA